MIVVSDSSPITNLIHIHQESLLQTLFQSVIIPRAVEEELLKSYSALPEFIQVSAPSDLKTVVRLQKELDRGEAEAIVLAAELNADLILIDERLGRRVAEREGLTITGLLGVLLEAKQRHLIPSVALLIDQLEQRAGFRLSKSLKADALRLAGEPLE